MAQIDQSTVPVMGAPVPGVGGGGVPDPLMEP